jgi:hypothetical protein
MAFAGDSAIKALLVVVAVSSTACINATFYSKTGRSQPPIAERAVILSSEEVQLVQIAGGYEIGHVNAEVRARGMSYGVDDLTEKAARVASDRGGTHLLVHGTGTSTMTYSRPETLTRSCRRDDDSSTCETTYRPAAEWTEEHPTANYLVFRVPREHWHRLPEGLRPSPH